MLLQSPAISQDVDRNWVKKSGPKGNDFTSEECGVLAFLANLLGPYVPKLRMTDEDGRPARTCCLKSPYCLDGERYITTDGIRAVLPKDLSSNLSRSSTCTTFKRDEPLRNVLLKMAEPIRCRGSSRETNHDRSFNHSHTQQQRRDVFGVL
jgi:hypothetical protein